MWKSKRQDFHIDLQNACWRFAQFPQARLRISLNNQFRGGSILLDQGGSVLRCQKDRWQIGMIWIIGVRDARRPCADYGASLVPNSESDVDGSYAAKT